MSLNDGKYGYEVEEYSIESCLNDTCNYNCRDKIFMLRDMDFPKIDLQKHQKKNHFKGRTA